MNPKFDRPPQPSRAASSANTVRIACATATGGIAFLALLGWLSGNAALVSIIPGLPGMSVLTATSFLLSTCALGAFGLRLQAARRFLIPSLASLILLGSAYALARYGTNLALHGSGAHGSGQAAMPPNLMSPNTAVTFLLFAASLLLIDTPIAASSVKTKPGAQRLQQWPYQVLALAVVLNVVTALLGQLIGVTYLYGITHVIGMALNTSVLFILIGTGVLCSHPERGVMAVLTNGSIAGRSARRLLPVASMAPIMLGGVALLMVRLQHETSLFAAYLVIVGRVVLLASMIWTTIMALHEQVELPNCTRSRLPAWSASGWN